MPHQLSMFTREVTPLNAKGDALRNANTTVAVAKAALELPGLVAAATTRTSTELLIVALTPEDADEIAEAAGYSQPDDFDVTEPDSSLLAGVAETIAEALGIESPNLRMSRYRQLRGVLFAPTVLFDRDGLFVDAEAIAAAVKAV